MVKAVFPGVVLIGLTVLHASGLSGSTAESEQTPTGASKPKLNQDAPRLDLYGDPLPPGAIARLGTVRFRVGSWSNGVAYTPDGKKLMVAGSVDFAANVLDANTGRPLHRVGYDGWGSRQIISPDGSMLLTGPGFTLIDIASRKTVRQLENDDEFTFVSEALTRFSPDGRIISSPTFSRDRAVGIWDVTTGKKLRDLKGRPSSPEAAAISLDSKSLALMCVGDRALHLWDITTGDLIRSVKVDLNIANTRSLTFSPDGRMLATSMIDGVVWLLHVETGTAFQGLKVDDGSKGPVAISKDGKLAASSMTSGLYHLIDLATRKELRRWQGPIGYGSLAFSPDGRVLADSRNSFPRSASILRWEFATGKELEIGVGHRWQCNTLRFSSNGNSLFSCSADRFLEWDPATGKVTREPLETPFAPAGEMLEWRSFSSDGKFTTAMEVAMYYKGIELVKEKLFHVWDTVTGKPFRSFKTPTWCRESQISPNGKFLFSAHQDGGRLWDVGTGTLLHHWAGGEQFSGTFSPDSRLLAFQGGRGKTSEIQFWDPVTKKEVQAWETALGSSTEPIVMSSDGTLVALRSNAGSGDTVVAVCATATGNVQSRFKIDGSFGYLNFSPSGRVLAMGVSGRSGGGKSDPTRTGKIGMTHFIDLWEVPTGKRIRRFESPHGTITALAFSPDGRTLATAGEDSTILTWDLANDRQSNKPAPTAPSAAQLDGLWHDLAGDAPKADRAIWAMVLSPQQSLPFLKDRCLVKPATPEQVSKLLADLNSDKFAVREKAAKELEILGQAAEAALRESLKKDLPLEVQRRIEQILPKRDQAALRYLRAIDVLESIGTTEARQVVKMLADESPNPQVSAAAGATLARLAKRN